MSAVRRLSLDEVLAERLLTPAVRRLLGEKCPGATDDEMEWRSWPQTFGSTAGPWPGCVGGAAMTPMQVTVARGLYLALLLVFVDGDLYAYGKSDDRRFWEQFRAHELATGHLAEYGLTVLDEPLCAPVERPGWDEWALGVAAAVATRADCTRRQVGAVMLTTEHRVVGTGYNGYPAGQPGCLSAGACPRGRLGYDQVAAGTSYLDGDGICGASHAEENCVTWCDRAARAGATLYVTDEPCPNCKRFLTGTGIAAVVWPGGRIDYTPLPGGASS